MKTIKKLWNYLWGIYHKYEEILNYLISGAIGVVISVVSYALSRKIGFGIIESNIISWVIAVICMYILNKLFVFKSKCSNRKELLKEFFSFVSARIFTFFVETFILWLGADVLKINDILIKIIAQIVIIILNYILSKIWIFNKEKRKTKLIKKESHKK